MHLVQDGYDRLLQRNWPVARTTFESAIAQGANTDARDGLGIALWWLNEIPDCHKQRTAAFTEYRTRGNLRPAAYLAAWLAREQVFLSGNSSAMNG